MRSGFSLSELILTVAVLAVLATYVLTGLAPEDTIKSAQNLQREQAVAQIADAIAQYSEDVSRTLFESIPQSPSSAIEICGTPGGSCSGLLDLGSALVTPYLGEVPYDPVTGSSTNTRYFVVRPASNRFTVSAPDAALSETIQVSR